MSSNVINLTDQKTLGVFRIEDGGWQPPEPFTFQVVQGRGGLRVARTTYGHTGFFTPTLFGPVDVEEVERLYNEAARESVELTADIIFGLATYKAEYAVSFSVPTEVAAELIQIWETIPYICLMHRELYVGSGPEFPNFWAVGFGPYQAEENHRRKLTNYFATQGVYMVGWREIGPSALRR